MLYNMLALSTQHLLFAMSVKPSCLPLLVECFRCGLDTQTTAFVPGFRIRHVNDCCENIPHCGTCYRELIALLRIYGRVQEPHGKLTYTYADNSTLHLIAVISGAIDTSLPLRLFGDDTSVNRNSSHIRDLVRKSDFETARGLLAPKIGSADDIITFNAAKRSLVHRQVVKRTVQTSLLMGICDICYNAAPISSYHGEVERHSTKRGEKGTCHNPRCVPGTMCYGFTSYVVLCLPCPICDELVVRLPCGRLYPHNRCRGSLQILLPPHDLTIPTLA